MACFALREGKWRILLTCYHKEGTSGVSLQSSLMIELLSNEGTTIALFISTN